MPLPKPTSNENRAEFISRCMSAESMSSEFPNRDQRLAVCSSIFDDSKQDDKMTDPNIELLNAVKSRGQKLTEFRYGILTADRYVRTLQDALGLEKCYRLTSDRNSNVSYSDMLSKAAKTLVYSNPEMELEDVYDSKVRKKLNLPKNTLMAFRHVLTTSREDRDGDIMRTKGAQIDPKMLLLWQHIATVPIGKFVREHARTDKKLEVVSAIVDVNEMAHDAAVMVDNDMARFSHGFRAFEYEARKKKDDDPDSGFDVTSFEVMEESLVSVPSNVDAQVQEVMLDLVEGGKLTSPLMQEYGRSLRSKRRVMVSVPNVEDASMPEEANNDKAREGERQKEEATTETSTSKEAEGNANEKANPTDAEVKLHGNGGLPGSWEYIENILRRDLHSFLESKGIQTRDEGVWAWIVGTFPNHVIVEVEKEGKQEHFKVAWTVENDVPVLVGELHPVEVVVSTEVREKAKSEMGDGKEEKGRRIVLDLKDAHTVEYERLGDHEVLNVGVKTGRVLSKSNESKLRDASDDLGEAMKSIDKSPRAAKSLVRGAKSNIDAVLKAVAAPPDEDGEKKEDKGKDDRQSPTVLASEFLARADRTERQSLLQTLRGLEENDRQADVGRQLQELMA